MASPSLWVRGCLRPALIIQHCIRTPTIAPTMEFSSLASKELVVHTESGYLYGVRANLDLLYEMPPAEQVRASFFLPAFSPGARVWDAESISEGTTPVWCPAMI